MSAHTSTNWADPTTCPFCGAELADPGAGFIDHIDDHGDCQVGFDEWRENVASDVSGEWSG